MTRFNHVALAALLLCGLADGMRAESPAPATEAAPNASAITAPIAALNAGLANTEKTASTPFPQRYAALAPVIDQSFDVKLFFRAIVGLHWASIPAPNQDKLVAAFRAFTIASYVANFNSDSGDKFQILPETRVVGADHVVETEIVPTSGDSTRIDYVMHESAPGTWRVVDVLPQGTISQVAVQRSDFRSLLTDGTGDALIASLNKRASDLSGGTIHP